MRVRGYGEVCGDGRRDISGINDVEAGPPWTRTPNHACIRLSGKAVEMVVLPARGRAIAFAFGMWCGAHLTNTAESVAVAGADAGAVEICEQ